jgi:teichuronic acid biosynthesis glycosyltransferase TuaG
MLNAKGEVLVSIVMPCFNGMKYLEEAVESIRCQTFTKWELLIIDNNSTDDSLALIEALAFEDSRISALQCSEPGAAKARNRGIEKARGRYIAFLDCDDLWLPEKLQRQIQAMMSCGAVFCWSSYRVINAVGKPNRDQLADQSINYESLMTKRCVIGCLTVIYDSERLGKLYMPNIRMRQDYALWSKIIRLANEQHFPLVGIRDILACYRVHDEAMTRNKCRAAFYQWCLYRDIEKLTVFTSLRYFWHYLFRALIDQSKTILLGRR